MSSESSDKRIGVFAEDTPYHAKLHYAQVFEEFPDFESRIADAEDPEKLKIQLKGVDFDRVDLVVADQYLMEPELTSIMKTFVRDLRTTNKTAWVVESTFE